MYMNNNRREARRWFDQGKHDHEAAKVNKREGFYEVACFLCQQSAEKVLKSFLYHQGERPVIGHSTYLLAKRCRAYESEFASVLDLCKSLDQYYIPTRYPNSLPGGIPHEVFTKEDARRALEGLRQIIALVSSFLDFDEEPKLEAGREETEE